jgi:hypothetical protein
MKKNILILASVLFSLNVNAQTNIKKDDIIGKWIISVAEFKNLYTYDLEKDSLTLGDTAKANLIKAHIPFDSVKIIMKPDIEIFAKMFFQFNVDGTGEIYWGQGPASDYKITYTVDEENSTITTTDRHRKNEPQKIFKLQEKILLEIKQTPQDGGMDIWMTLKKSN